jgi:hypothetical protein
MIGLKWLPEPEIYQTWIYDKIFSGYDRRGKQKKVDCQPKPPPVPVISRSERAAQFQAMLAADNRVNQAVIARKLGLSRAWLSRVLASS